MIVIEQSSPAITATETPLESQVDRALRGASGTPLD
jgi:hypothetical protein